MSEQLDYLSTLGLLPIFIQSDVSIKQNEYKNNHCWQYDIRLKNLTMDLASSGFTKEYTDSLSVNDFNFMNITCKKNQKSMVNFIKRHEWLGTISQYTTHWFAAYHKNILAGVILMNMPNSFSKMLGNNTPELERLISRGACISWSPKNLASSFLMWSIKWMVKNTGYRLFTAYSDPSANEIGTIYQACNFYYLGKKYGTTTRYINPFSGNVVSDRFFRTRSAYKKYANILGIEWEKDWNNDHKMLWSNMPVEIEKKLRDYSKNIIKITQKIEYQKKHKYAYVLGINKTETKKLNKIFIQNVNTYDYPKERGK